MHILSIVALFVFIAAWFGAAASWTVAAYSTMQVWANGSLALVHRSRTRAFRAGALAVTFIATGFIAGMVSGVLAHPHI